MIHLWILNMIFSISSEQFAGILIRIGEFIDQLGGTDVGNIKFYIHKHGIILHLFRSSLGLLWSLVIFLI